MFMLHPAQGVPLSGSKMGIGRRRRFLLVVDWFHGWLVLLLVCHFRLERSTKSANAQKMPKPDPFEPDWMQSKGHDDCYQHSKVLEVILEPTDHGPWNQKSQFSLLGFCEVKWTLFRLEVCVVCNLVQYHWCNLMGWLRWAMFLATDVIWGCQVVF